MPRSIRQSLQIVCACSLAASLLFFVVRSLHWPIVGDAALLHAIVFLAEHGFTPYRQILDPNLPGAYALEWIVMHTLGAEPLAWRMYDFLLLGVVAAGMLRVCAPSERFAGVFAAVLFALLHGRDGVAELGQRDLEMSALLALAAAVVAACIRKPGVRATAYAFMTGLLLGAAATIKPVALLLLPAWLPFLLRPLPRATALRCAGAFFAGALLPLAACCAWLGAHGALGAFAAVQRELVPLHAAMFRRPLHILLRGALPSVLLPLFVFTVGLAAASKPWRQPREAMLLTAAGVGLISFCAQGRGYPYHRYPLELFFLLLVALLSNRALGDRRGFLAMVGAASFAYGALWLAPRAAFQTARFNSSDPAAEALAGELRALGAARTNGQVQCLDQAGGCMRALNELGAVQSTGLLYDCYLYTPVHTANAQGEQSWYRSAFATAVIAHPPRFLVVSSDACGLRRNDFSYVKLSAWPPLAELLQSYSLAWQYTPTQTVDWNGKPAIPFGFQIYTHINP